MDCEETQILLHGFVDGELDLKTSLAIERHLQECPSCAEAHARLGAVREAIQGGSLYFQAPAGLRQRIQTSLGGTNAGLAPGGLRRRLLAVAASLALIAASGWGLFRVVSVHSAEESLDQALVANHLRSLKLPTHLVDVESSDQHVVKPWFEGKVNFSLDRVPDLKEQGFTLLGGRLDFLNDRAVAVLVYRRRQHVINLFIWPPAQEAESARKVETRLGYHLVRWTHAGMAYVAVSNLNEAELQEFAQRIQEKFR